MSKGNTKPAYHYKREETVETDRKKMMDQLIEWFKMDSKLHNAHNPIPLENFKWRLVRMTDAEFKFEFELWKDSNKAAGIFTQGV